MGARKPVVAAPKGLPGSRKWFATIPFRAGGAPVIAAMWAAGVRDGVPSTARPARRPRSAIAEKPPAVSFPCDSSSFSLTPPRPSNEMTTVRPAGPGGGVFGERRLDHSILDHTVQAVRAEKEGPLGGPRDFEDVGREVFLRAERARQHVAGRRAPRHL